MKRQTMLLTGALFTTVAVAVPGHAAARGHAFHDYAKVVDVEPIERWTEVPVERRVCRDRGHRGRHRDMNYRGHGGDHVIPTVLGGVVGGVIGSQIGEGDTRVIAAAAGTAVGAVVGHELSEGSQRVHHRQGRHRRCRTITEYERRREVIGYRVTYRYHGHRFTTRTDEHPGRRMRVRVKVKPDY